jgi:hypothetical protein
MYRMQQAGLSAGERDEEGQRCCGQEERAAAVCSFQNYLA